MEYNQNSSPVVVKLQELCKALVDDPQFASIRDRVSLFLSDEETRRQYENLNNKGMMLHGKQQSGVELTEEEINDFEKARGAITTNRPYLIHNLKKYL